VPRRIFGTLEGAEFSVSEPNKAVADAQLLIPAAVFRALVHQLLCQLEVGSMDPVGVPRAFQSCFQLLKPVPI